MLECDSPFWRFSLAVYAAPGVAPECLALQDDQGIDVNVLLFCAWCGSTRRVLTEGDLATIESAIQPWRDAVIAPLRAVRRSIKTVPDAAQDTVAALRQDVAALELRAEQVEQAMLYRTIASSKRSSGLASAEVAIRLNIALLLRKDTELPERLVAAALTHAGRP
jgi:uncharacterized protein (TIGR02444 family)